MNTTLTTHPLVSVPSPAQLIPHLCKDRTGHSEVQGQQEETSARKKQGERNIYLESGAGGLKDEGQEGTACDETTACVCDGQGINLVRPRLGGSKEKLNCAE